MFWKKLTNKTPKLPKYDEPLGLRIGAAVTLKALDFKILGEQLKTVFPGETLIVKKYGMATMDGKVKLHFFYTDTDAVIRVTTENDEVKEINLFHLLDSVYPSDEDDWDMWIGEEGLIGDPLFTLVDGTEYERVLFEDSDKHVDPLSYQETISVDIETTGSDYLVEHESMLYARFVDKEETVIEWLVVDAIDTGESAQINIMPGVTLDEIMFEVV